MRKIDPQAHTLEPSSRWSSWTSERWQRLAGHVDACYETSMGLGLSFDEVMEGVFTPNGAPSPRPLRFELHVEVASALGLISRVVGRAEGALWLSGLAEGAHVSGTLEISTLFEHRLRYRLHFRGADGRPFRFEGDKDVSFRRHLVGWTTLPGALYDGEGMLLGSAELHFDVVRRLGPFLRSFRLRRSP